MELLIKYLPLDAQQQKLNKKSSSDMVSLPYCRKLAETACDLTTSYLPFAFEQVSKLLIKLQNTIETYHFPSCVSLLWLSSISSDPLCRSPASIKKKKKNIVKPEINTLKNWVELKLLARCHFLIEATIGSLQSGTLYIYFDCFRNSFGTVSEHLSFGLPAGVINQCPSRIELYHRL